MILSTRTTISIGKDSGRNPLADAPYLAIEQALYSLAEYIYTETRTYVLINTELLGDLEANIHRISQKPLHLTASEGRKITIKFIWEM